MSERDGRDVSRSIRELRQYARDDLAEVDHSDAHPWAGVVEDARIREHLTFFAESIDGDPLEHTYVRRVLRRYGTEAVARAVEQGDETSAEYLVGLPSYERDVSGIHAIRQLGDWLLDSEETKIIYQAGNMGRGKTDLSLLLAEIVLDREEDAEIASNIRSSDLRYIGDYPTLRKWVESGDVGAGRWFIFDEASSELSGYSGDREQVEKHVSSLMKKARKNGIGGLIVIGHTGKDVHPDIRRLSDYLQKRGKTSARIYSSLRMKNDEAVGVGHIMDLDRIPPTSLDYDTADSASWDWGDALDEEPDESMSEDELRDRLALRGARLWSTSDLNQDEVAEALSVGEIEITRTRISEAANGKISV
jgi:predicted XRE-type DNA-binding protein